MNIDVVFAFVADMRFHKRAHICTYLCPTTAKENLIMQSTLCVLPTWQMHLLSKSWWIFHLNFKSKPHFAFPSLLREPLMSAMPLTSPSNHSLTKQQWKKTLLWVFISLYLHWMLGLCDEWEQHIVLCLISDEFRICCPFLLVSSPWLWQTASWSVSLCYFSVLFFSF